MKCNKGDGCYHHIIRFQVAALNLKATSKNVIPRKQESRSP